MEEDIIIDFERLRDDLKDESLGAYFGGGFGGALMEYIDIDFATPTELVEMARRQGMDLAKYQV